MVVTALTFSLAIPAMTFRIVPSWHTFTVFHLIVFSTGCASSALSLFLTVHIYDWILVDWNTLAINNFVILNARSTFSTQLAVFLTVLGNYSTDSMVVKEIALFTLETFSWTALTSSRFTEWIFSSWSAHSFFKFIEWSAFDTFFRLILFSTIRIWLSSTNLNYTIASNNIKSISTLSTFTFSVCG